VFPIVSNENIVKSVFAASLVLAVFLLVLSSSSAVGSTSENRLFEDDVESVLISPDQNQTLTAGETIDFDAEAYDGNGTLITDDPSDFSWENTTSEGLFEKTAAGSYRVTAEFENQSSNAVYIDVEPAPASGLDAEDIEAGAGQEDNITVSVLDEYDNRIEGETVIITDDDTLSGVSSGDSSVTNESGVVTFAFNETVSGEYEVVFASGTFMDISTVEITPSDVHTLEVTPEDATLLVNESQEYTAHGYDQYSNHVGDLTDQVIWWDNVTDSDWVGNELIPKTPGVWNVTAVYEDVEGEAIIDVQSDVTTDITIKPVEDMNITAGDDLQFVATAYNDEGYEITSNPVDFEWKNTTVSGVFEKTEARSYEVRAEKNGVSSHTVNVTVEVGEAVEIDIDSEETNVIAGGNISYYATSFDEYGNKVENVTSVVSWSDNVPESEWDNNILTPISSGDWVVTAEFNNMIAETSIEVDTADAAELVIEPQYDDTIEAGTTLQFDAELLDVYNNLITDDNEFFSWDNTTDMGEFTKTTAGTYEVRAYGEGLSSDEVSISVTPSTVDEVNITPTGNPIITGGDEIDFNAEAMDEYGNLLTDYDADFEWHGTSKTGLFTEVSAGDHHVSATYETASSEETVVTVEPAGLDGVELHPNDIDDVTTGEEVVFGAEAVDEYGNVLESDDLRFDWRNTTRTGVFNKTTPGQYVVSASYENVTSQELLIDVNIGDVHVVELDPSGEVTALAGESVEFTASAYDEYDNLISSEVDDFQWVNASSSGLFYETQAAEYIVSASYEDVVSVPVEVTVEPSEVDRISTEPSGTVEITAGESFTFAATATDEYDNVVEDDNLVFSWTNAQNDGTFDTVEKGEYPISAEYEGVESSTVLVLVEPDETVSVTIEGDSERGLVAGESLQLNASAHDTHGNLVTEKNSDFDWENATENGVFYETTADIYTITASYEGIVSSPVNIDVFASELDGVEITPVDLDDMGAGEAVNFSAEAVDEFGNIITDVPVDFGWENTTQNGVFQETQAGRYVVKAHYEEKTSSAVEVDVVPGETDEINIYPNEDQEVVADHDPIYFEALAYDEYGNEVEDDVKEFVWEDVTEDGVFYRTDAGTYEISATYDGVSSDVVYIDVLPGDLYGVNIEPDGSVEAEAGVDMAFDAVAVDRFDNVITSENSEFSWTNTSNSGVFKERTPGEYEVEASFESQTSPSVSVTVVPSEPYRIHLSPPSARTITVGEQINFSASVEDEFGNIITDSDDDFTWQNTDAHGLFHMTEDGVYLVEASYEGLSRSVPVSVNPGPVEDVLLVPNQDVNVSAGDPVVFNAEARDEYNNTITDDDQSFVWTGTDENGVFYETEAGSYEVRAEYDGVLSPTVSVMVEPEEIAYAQIYPSEDTQLQAGTSLQFTATAYDRYHNAVTSSADDFTWTNVTKEGLFYREETGVYEVSAAIEDITTDAVLVEVVVGEPTDVNIRPNQDVTLVAGEEGISFEASAYDHVGNLITDDPENFEWTGADGSGQLYTTDAGAYDVFASLDDVSSRTVTVEVVPGEPQELELDMSLDDLEAGDEVTFSAVLQDRYENEIEDVTDEASWSISSPGTDTKDNTISSQDNTVLVDSSGEWEVTVNHQEFNQTKRFDVQPSDPYQIEVDTDLEEDVVKAGRAVELNADILDEYGNLVEDGDVTWINATDGGVFQEEETGDYNVRAVHEDGLEQTVLISVKAAEPHHVEVDVVDDPVVEANETVQFDGEVVDKYGNTIIDDRTHLDWNRADDGLFRETRSGEYEVWAAYEGVRSDYISIEVIPSHAVTVETDIEDPVTLSAGEEMYIGAVALDSYGNVVNDASDGFEWINLSSHGGFSQTSAGTYEVKVVYEDISVAHTIEVEPGEADDIEVDWSLDESMRDSEELRVCIENLPLSFDAVAFDEYGNVITEEDSEFLWDNANETGQFYTGEEGFFTITVSRDDISETVFVQVVEPEPEDEEPEINPVLLLIIVSIGIIFLGFYKIHRTTADKHDMVQTKSKPPSRTEDDLVQKAGPESTPSDVSETETSDIQRDEDEGVDSGQLELEKKSQLLKRDIEEEKQLLSEKADRLKSLKRKIGKSQQLREKLQERKEKLSSKARQLKEVKDELEEEKEMLLERKNKVQVLQSDIEEKKERLSELQEGQESSLSVEEAEEHEEKINSLKEQLAEAKEKFEAKKDELEQKKKILTKKENKLKKYKKRVRSLKEKLEKLAEDGDKSNIEEVKTKLENGASKLKETKRQHNRLKERIDELERGVAKQRNVLKEKRDSLKTETKEYKKKQERSSEVDGKAVESVSEEIEEEKEKLEKAKKELKQSKKKVEDLTASLKELKADVEAERENIGKLEEELDDVCPDSLEQLSEKQAELKTNVKEIRDSLNDKMDELEDVNQKLKKN